MPEPTVSPLAEARARVILFGLAAAAEGRRAGRAEAAAQRASLLLRVAELRADRVRAAAILDRRARAAAALRLAAEPRVGRADHLDERAFLTLLARGAGICAGALGDLTLRQLAADLVGRPELGRADDWAEEDHPRDPDGKFGSGGGGGGELRKPAGGGGRSSTRASASTPEASAAKVDRSQAKVAKTAKALAKAEATETAAREAVFHWQDANREQTNHLRNVAQQAHDAHEAAVAAARTSGSEEDRARAASAKETLGRAEREMIAHEAKSDPLHKAWYDAQQATKKATADQEKAVAAHAKNVAAHEKLVTGGDAYRGREAVARGLVTRAGEPAFTAHAQAELRAVTAHEIQKYAGITPRGDLPHKIVEVQPRAAIGGAAGLANPLNGSITLEQSVARNLAEHAAYHDLHALGREFKAADPKAFDMVNAQHTMVHEQIHQSGPRLLAIGGTGLMAEEMTTEMAARTVVAAQHGMTLNRFDFSAYNNFIEPTVQKLSDSSGKSLHDAHIALGHASVEYKQTNPAPGEWANGDAVLKQVASSALTRLGVTDPAAHDSVHEHVLNIGRGAVKWTPE